MTNAEWIIKNWNNKVQTYDKTVGNLYIKGKSCFFIRTCSDYECTRSSLEWLDSEATEDNNLYFNDVQKD